MDISSPAFEEHKTIPVRYTCQGDDLSPPLVFGGVPSNAVSLALVVDDPDAPSGTFDHWIVWNISPDTKALKEGAKVPNQGRNGSGKSQYNGPCPPPGKTHHYYFKLYALDIKIQLADGSSKIELEKAMKGHILDQTELVGLFQR